jgi:alkanesulfonate monooxygenase SsuD/methylene tetrahydromethanopterin reductase-like flavin-dependent oxidoreductase (luciferase family)
MNGLAEQMKAHFQVWEYWIDWYTIVMIHSLHWPQLLVLLSVSNWLPPLLLAHSTIMLYSQTAASLDALSGGRLVLGLAVGARKEDYDAAGVGYRDRGKRLSEQLSALRSIWEDNKIGPETTHHGGPDLLVGGLSDQSYARMVRYTDGYVHGGGPPRAFARAADKAYAAWSDSGRPGKPQIWSQGYFALGNDDLIKAAYHYLRDYYAFTGPFAERIAAGLLTSPQAVAQFIRGYQNAGCDELVLFPTVPAIAQLDRLAEILYAQGMRRAV